MNDKTIAIIGGGTVSHVRNHLALTAPAYGKTARYLDQLLDRDGRGRDYNRQVCLTKMACSGGGRLETNEDISDLVDRLVDDPKVRIIFFNPALVDYNGNITVSSLSNYIHTTPSGKYKTRLKTSDGDQKLILTPTQKILGKIRKERKDIFLVAFKTTCGATEDEQFLAGLNLLKTNSCNLVLANDTLTRLNMIITPEQARYDVSANRDEVLSSLVKMTLDRAEGTFTRSNVVNGETVDWNSDLIPSSLREVVNHCIKGGAYKPFNGATVGHFATKVSSNSFITSKRKVNFNDLDKVGMVLCISDGANTITAFGAKPSVGGVSQRIIFNDHPEVDCIVHFHVPLRNNNGFIPVKSQKENECGSDQCGKNTSDGLRIIKLSKPPYLKCVYLDNHGPNIVFNRNIDPKVVIDFINTHFDLSKSTDQVDRSKVQTT